jgi:hypothetical protein
MPKDSGLSLSTDCRVFSNASDCHLHRMIARKEGEAYSDDE